MPLFLLQREPPLRGVWKIEESSEELLRRLAGRGCLLLPAEIHTEKRRQEWLAARVLLKELTGEATPIAYRDDGAPYLPEKNLHISISHTKGFAAVVVSDRCAVGIDIEYLSDRIRKVRDRFLRPEEEAMIDAGHETEHLLLCWCAKETLFKLPGQRGVDIREHLHVFPFACRASGEMIVAETCTPRAASYTLHYMINKYFAMTWSAVPLDMTLVSRPLLLNSAIMVFSFLIR